METGKDSDIVYSPMAGAISSVLVEDKERRDMDLDEEYRSGVISR